MGTERIQMTRGALLDALADGAVVATGNTRLSRSLAADYERRMLALGRVAWATPPVLPLEIWQQQLFEDAALLAERPLPRLLSLEQEEQLWAGLIRADATHPHHALLRVDAAARCARAAWKLVSDWQLPLADGRFDDKEGSASFRRWAQRFQAECRRRGFASGAAVSRLSIPLIEAGLCELPERLLLAGFYELTPAQQALLKTLRAAGCAVDWVELTGPTGRPGRFRADNAWHEMVSAASWARQILEQTPDARIGIVVPDLAARRSALAHILGKALDPAAMQPGAAPAHRPWNLSLGRPLADYPVVATALRLLSLMQQLVTREVIGVLLLSPHWALSRDPAERAVELDRRALLDRRLRSLGDASMPLSSLRWHARGERGDGTHRPWRSEGLAARLGSLVEVERSLPGNTTTSAWAAVFTEWLKQAGWAGCAVPSGDTGRPLDSHEFQAVEAWNALLSRFSSLDDFAGTLSRGAALALLGRLAAGTLFQPRARDAPVQVLGLHEAIGQFFDHLWVMGLNDVAWPPPASPDPFIPIGLQREHAVPHSTPEFELHWAGQMTARLAAAAPEVVFSYPARDGTEELDCSPLIAPLPALDFAWPLGAAQSRWQDLMKSSASAEPAPPPEPIPLRNVEVSGGSALFRDQAACPFKAFAVHRLGAEPLERVLGGLDAKRRGTLMHEVLERLWQELQSQARLLALDEDALRGLVRKTVDGVLEEKRSHSPATLTARYRAVEARRLEERTLAWLDVERQRRPFTLTDHERLQHFETGGLRLRMKIDRVDQLEDGSQVVIDYKTGKVTPAAWFGQRPEEPQLPLYGVARRAANPSAPVAAVAFAKVHPGQMGFSGVVREGSVLPGLPVNRKGDLKDATDNWPAVLDQWALELERLALGFREGDAAVDPKHGLKTCENSWCMLAPLCRVRESLPGVADASEQGEASDGEESAHG
jgi:ATP-dependent helicase/nuclease subunit B